MPIIRIFQIAKELNISHTDILSFLDSKGVDIKSHMSPVDDDIRNLIMAEFAKDKKLVERFRKERVRKEIYDTRLKEKQESQKKLQLLSLQEQRKIEKTEKINSSRENEEIMDVPVDRADKRTGSSKSVKAVKKNTLLQKNKTKKINLSNIQSEIGRARNQNP